MLPKTVLQHGSEHAATEAISLQAGPLTMIFEPDSAFLRYVRLGDHEVVRAIYGAVRDKYWRTLTPVVTNLQVAAQPNAFQLSCDVRCREGDIEFSWNVTATGDPSGTITYRFSGVAGSSFYRNRIGICILHPVVECAGKPCRVERPDGSAETLSFPTSIAPWQPFKGVRGLRHEVTLGQQVEFRFEGDVFETEDQRNWTDASFKTYSTPLELGWPALVEKGATVNQTVQVSLPPPQPKVLPVLHGRGAQLSIATTPVLERPPVGVALPPEVPVLSEHQINRLKALHLPHLRVDVPFSTANWRGSLERASTTAKQLGCGLHVALTLTDDGANELRALRSEVERLRAPVTLWLVFHEKEVVTTEKWVAQARAELQGVAPNVLIAAGTRAWFTELNRNRPGPEFSAFPCYTLNPEVHLIDPRSVIENLGAQAATAETARQVSARPVLISPITLRMQNNPGVPAIGGADRLPADVDCRQMSLFGAAWTLGSLARLSVCGNVHSLTYFETVGWKGIMESESGSPSPQLFRSLPGSVFPVYHLLADLAGFGRVYPTHSSHPLQVDGLTLLDAQNRQRILVANFLGQPQEVKIKTGTCRVSIRYLDDTNAEEAMIAPEKFRAQAGRNAESVAGKIGLNLLPYALARVDVL